MKRYADGREYQPRKSLIDIEDTPERESAFETKRKNQAIAQMAAELAAAHARIKQLEAELAEARHVEWLQNEMAAEAAGLVLK